MKYPVEKTPPHPVDYTVSGQVDWNLIPEHMIGGLRRYIENGIPPGHFLQAVLKNDLREAINRGDDTNRKNLANYVIFLYNYAPTGSWGGEEEYKTWIQNGGLNGG